ncbi:MAG: SAM-dependent methyltransferase [Desulfovibrio sp.]
MKLLRIGKIKTPYKEIAQCPKNISDDGPVCILEVDDVYVKGLSGMNELKYIQVLYWFEGVDRELMVQKKRGTGPLTGTFALRSPHRPNPIAVADVLVDRVEGNKVYVRGLDCLDGTVLLDIKISRERK